MGAGSDYNATADGTVELTSADSGWLDVDVSDMVQTWVADPAANHGLVLLPQAASGSVTYSFCSELGWTPVYSEPGADTQGVASPAPAAANTGTRTGAGAMTSPWRMLACIGLVLALIWDGGPAGAWWAAPAFALRAPEGSDPAQPLAGELSGVAQVSAGGSHTCALTLAGGVKCWGNNISGQLGDGTTRSRGVPVAVLGLLERVVMVSAGSGHTCAVTATGGAKCWGDNRAGQLGDGPIIIVLDTR